MFHNQHISPQWIIEAMIALGFPEKNRDGICYGIAGVLIQFINTRKIEPYRDLIFGIIQLINIYGIEQFSDLVKRAKDNRIKITKVYEKLLLEGIKLSIFPFYKEITLEDIRLYDQAHFTNYAVYYQETLKNSVEEKLSNEDKLIFKMEALFDNLQFTFFAETNDGSFILNKDEMFYEQDFQKTFPFTKIDFENTINEQVQVKHFTDLFNLYWLTNYLKTFESEFNAINQLTTPISFLITGTDHAVSIAYDPLTKSWKLAGQEFLTIPEGLPAEIIAPNLLWSFNDGDLNAESALCLKMIANEAEVPKLQQFLFNLEQNTTWQILRAQIKERSQLNDHSSRTPLSIAMRDGDLAYAFMATQNVPWDQMPDTYQYLMLAIEYNVKPLIAHLMQTPLINRRDNTGITPLLYSIETDNFELMCKLLLYGADPNLSNREGKLPLHFAALINDIPSLSKLCQHGANVNLLDSHGYTALHYAVQMRSIPAISLLLEYGAIYTLTNSNGHDAFDYAVYLNASEVINLFIKKFIVDGSQYLIEPSTFFMLCEHVTVSQDKSSVFAVLDYGVDFSSITQKSFNQLSVIHTMPDVWLRMLQGGLNPNLRDGNNNTLLHLACLYGVGNTVDFLIGQGVKVNSINSNAESPLVVASRVGSIDCVRRLLAHNAIITPAFGQSAIVTAIENNHLEIVKEFATVPRLLEEKVNGETPLAIAKRLGNHQMMNFIRDSIAAKQVGTEATQFGKKTNLRILPQLKRPRPT